MNINDFNNRIARCESFLIASDGQFLGKLSLNRYDIDSIPMNMVCMVVSIPLLHLGISIQLMVVLTLL